MKRILVTRPEPGASQTASRLLTLGFEPVMCPVLAIKPVAEPIYLPSHIAATAITSRNAVEACPPASYQRPAFVVGSATATCARDAGFAHVIDADGNAATLAALIADRLSPSAGSLFFPTARGQGFELAKDLRSRGYRVLRRVAYAAEPVPELPLQAITELQSGTLTAALFFSAETARHFVRLVRAKGLSEAVHDIEAVSISERPAVPLRRLPWRRISVAAKPNQDAMLALLQ